MDINQIYKTIFEKMKEAVYVRDRQMNIIYINPAGERLLGWSPRELYNRKCYEVFGDTSVACQFVCPAEQIAAGNFETTDYESKIKTKSGESIDMRCSMYPLHNKNNEMIGVTVMMMNISELKKADLNRIKAIKAMEEEMRLREIIQDEFCKKSEEQNIILDNIDALVWTLKNPETIGFVNYAYADFLGIDKNSLENRSLREIYSSEESEAVIRENIELFQNKKAYKSEKWVLNCKKDKRLLSVSKFPKNDESGKIEYFLCIANDITKVKKLEEDLLRAYQEMEKRIQDRISEFNRQNRVLEIELNEFKKSAGNLHAVIDNLKNQVENKSTEVENLKIKLNKEIIENQILQDENEKLQSSVKNNITDNSQLIEELKASLDEKHNELFKLNEHLNNLSKAHDFEISRLKKEIKEKDEAILNERREHKSFENDIVKVHDELEVKIQEKREEISELQEKISQEIDQKIALENKLKTLNDELENTNAAHHSHIARLEGNLAVEIAEKENLQNVIMELSKHYETLYSVQNEENIKLSESLEMEITKNQELTEEIFKQAESIEMDRVKHNFLADEVAEISLKLKETEKDKDYEVFSLREELKTEKEMRTFFENEFLNFKNDLSKKDTLTDEVAEIKNQLENEIATLENTNNELQTLIEELNTNLESKNKDIESLMFDLNHENELRKSKENEIQATKDELGVTINQLNAEISALKEDLALAGREKARFEEIIMNMTQNHGAEIESLKQHINEHNDTLAASEKNLEKEIRRTHKNYLKAISNSKGIAYQINLSTGMMDFLNVDETLLSLISSSEISVEEFNKLTENAEIIDQEIESSFAEYYNELKNGNIESFRVHRLINGKNGFKKWYADNAVPVYDDEGKITGILGIISDITDKRNLEDELYSERATLAATLQNIDNAVIVIDNDRNIILNNNYGKELLATASNCGVGEQIETLFGKSITEIIQYSEKNPDEILEISSGEENIRLFSIISRPLSICDKQVGYVILARDITEERELQNKARNKDKLELIGKISRALGNEFNNLLTGIIGYAEVLQMRTDLPHSTIEYLDKIMQLGHDGSSMIKQFLDISRKSQIEHKTFNFATHIMNLMNSYEIQMPENIKLKFSKRIGDYLVSGDPNLIECVMNNIIDNCIDRIEGNGIIDAKLSRFAVSDNDTPPAPELSNGEWIRIRIADNGSEIPEHVIEKLADPIFAINEIGNRTNVRLAQMFSIIRMHNGLLTIKNKEGKGVIFNIFLPAITVSDEKISAASLRQNDKNQKTVLVVEKDENVSNVIQLMLNKLGYNAIAARTGKEGYRIYEQQKNNIEMILMDSSHTLINGMDFVGSCRNINSDVKILAMSGYSEEGDNGKQYNKNVTDWIQKPLNISSLANKINHIIDRQESQVSKYSNR